MSAPHIRVRRAAPRATPKDSKVQEVGSPEAAEGSQAQSSYAPAHATKVEKVTSPEILVPLATAQTVRKGGSGGERMGVGKRKGYAEARDAHIQVHETARPSKEHAASSDTIRAASDIDPTRPAIQQRISHTPLPRSQRGES